MSSGMVYYRNIAWAMASQSMSTAVRVLSPVMDEPEPGFLHASVSILDTPHHVMLFRVQQDLDPMGGIANQRPHPDLLPRRAEELTDLWAALDNGGGGPWQLLELPNHEGTWWPCIVPHRTYLHRPPPHLKE